MPASFTSPADRRRQTEIMPLLIKRVLELKDNPAYPLHKERTVRYMVDRWSCPDGFELLDELCGVAGLGDSLFPDIPPIRLYGTEFGEGDILHVEIEWLGTDGIQMVIDYHREAHARKVAERDRAIEEERAHKANMYPSLGDVLGAYRSLRRAAWIPVTAEGQGEEKGSRYFGLPWMPDGEEWPMNEAGNQLSFVMQIGISGLPAAVRRYFGFEDEGIVSLFYDLDGEWQPDRERSDDLETNARVIFYDNSLPGGVRQGKMSIGEAHQIVSWRSVGDYPKTDDAVACGLLPASVADCLGITGLPIGGAHHRTHGSVTTAQDVFAFISACEEIWGRGSCDAETAAEALDLFCGSGNKLGGWPSWDGRRLWPTSRGERMVQFFQIDMMDSDWKGFVFWRGDERGRISVGQGAPRDFRLTWDGLIQD